MQPDPHRQFNSAEASNRFLWAVYDFHITRGERTPHWRTRGWDLLQRCLKSETELEVLREQVEGKTPALAAEGSPRTLAPEPGLLS